MDDSSAPLCARCGMFSDRTPAERAAGPPIPGDDPSRLCLACRASNLQSELESEPGAWLPGEHYPWASVELVLLPYRDRLRVAIRLRDDATQDEIRAVIPLAQEWQRRLIAFQGADPCVQGYGRLAQIDRWRRLDGLQYQQIATRLNVKAASLLRELDAVAGELAARGRTMYEAFEAAGDNEGEMTLFFRVVRAQSAQIEIQKMLSALNLEREKIEEFLNFGSKNLAALPPAVARSYPVDAERVKRVLRALCDHPMRKPYGGD